MLARSRYTRPVALLLGLCVAAGVLAAGIVFPAVAGLGMVSNDAGDTVTSVSTDVVDGPLPVATIVTDVKGAPIARFFEPNRNRQVVTSDRISPAMKADHRDRGPALLPAQRCGLAGHHPRGDRQLGVR